MCVRARLAVFKTPLPNNKLWNGFTIGTLASPDVFINGGWWHDSRILAATGEGLAKEEPRAWEGWWNDRIVELVRLSVKQKDALCVLLTGRSESGFGDLIRRIVASKGLEFDMMSLKPAVGPNNQRFASTMIFKQMFLEALMETYKEAMEIRIYEDRPKHVKGFRDFMTEYNKKQSGVAGYPATRGPIRFDVVQVADMATNLDPVVEVAEVQHLVNAHNEALVKRAQGMRGEKLIIKKTVFYTGYLIKPADTHRLLTLAQLPAGIPDAELKYHANNIMICPRPCPHSILEKVGGMGSKMTWQVTGTACFEDSIWAACLRPVPGAAKFHTDNPSPLVVLALRRGARPIDAGKIHNWQPVPPDKAFIFETTVGEKVLLRIEAEDPSENEYESLFPNKSAKRRHTENDEPGHRQHTGSYAQVRNYHHHAATAYAGRGGPGGQGRGGYRGGGPNNRGYRSGPRGGGQSRGRGGKGKAYHSLDDVGSRQSQGGFAQQVTYDDVSNQPPPQQQQQQQHRAPQRVPQYQAPGFQPLYHSPAAQRGGFGGAGGGGDLQQFY